MLIKLILGWLLSSISYAALAQTKELKRPINSGKNYPSKNQSNTNTRNYEPEFFLLIDSIAGRWENTFKEIQLRTDEFQLNTTVADANGIIYAIGVVNKNGNYGEHLVRFINEDWENFEQNLSGNIINLLSDGQGHVYAITASKIYLAEADKWKELTTGSFTRFNVFTGFDGCIYYNVPVYEKKVYAGSKLFKIKDTKPELILDNGKSLIVTGNLYADRKGHIYQQLGKQTGIKIWNGKEWTMTDDIYVPVDSYWAFDKNNTLYIAGCSAGKSMFIKQLNGLSWKNLEIPDSISKMVYDWQLLMDAKGNVFLHAERNFEEATLYRILGDKLELVANQQTRTFATSQKIKKIMASGSHFIALQEKQSYLEDGNYKKSFEPVYIFPEWIVKVRKMANIPNAGIISSEDSNSYRNLYNCYLFEDDGKYGLQTKEGRIIAEPVFDKIYIGYTPTRFTELKVGEDLCAIGTDYCYTLIQGRDTLYSYIGKYDFELPDRRTLALFKCKVSGTCNYCKGSGIIEAHNEVVTIKGNWVPPVTTSSISTTYEKRWDGILKRDVMYISTRTSNSVVSGGYYEPDTQKTIKVPERKCVRCEGRAIKRSYLVYKFDSARKAYLMSWN